MYVKKLQFCASIIIIICFMFNFMNLYKSSGAVGGKTGKTSVLPRFSKIESGGGSGGGAPQWWAYLSRARAPRRRRP
jgi:hypothetical protein